MENAEAAFNAVTNQPSAANQTVILKMVIEDYNRYGSEGMGSVSFGSASEDCLEDYLVDFYRRFLFLDLEAKKRY